MVLESRILPRTNYVMRDKNRVSSMTCEAIATQFWQDHYLGVRVDVQLKTPQKPLKICHFNSIHKELHRNLSREGSGTVACNPRACVGTIKPLLLHQCHGVPSSLENKQCGDMSLKQPVTFPEFWDSLMFRVPDSST